MTIGEVTAYGSAWQRGQRWEIAPHEIPIGYVTSAGALWRRSGYYKVDSGIPTAPAWWVGASGPVGQSLRAFSQSASSSKATRTLAGREITLLVKPASQVFAYAVEETLPRGVKVTSISGGGSFDTVNGKIKWGPFFDSQERSFTYTLQSVGLANLVDFAGVASFDGTDVAIVYARVEESPEPSASISFDQTTGFQLRIEGQPGSRVAIRASTDLKGWVTVTNLTLTSESTLFSDQSAVNAPYRFYQVRSNGF
jgi:hypothetical protein